MAMKVRYTVVNGEVLGENRGGVKRDYVPDPLGSTVALLDNTQAKTDTWEYWPYGEVRTRTGTISTPFQFVGTRGYYRDSASRSYVRARTYRQDLARWLTRDPIGFWGVGANFYQSVGSQSLNHDLLGFNSEINLYSYAGNTPITHDDPTGLSVRVCTRPVVGCFSGPEYGHWFLWTGLCGCIGWGQHGVIWGCQNNLGGFGAPDTECMTLSSTPAQEKCICDTATAAAGGAIVCGHEWKSGDKYCLLKPSGDGIVCQDFVDCLRKQCRLPGIPWPRW